MDGAEAEAALVTVCYNDGACDVCNICDACEKVTVVAAEAVEVQPARLMI
jgi:hypothetical protein